MLTFIEVAAKNVVGINIRGKISDPEFDAVVALLEKKMQNHAQVRMYVEMESFKGFEPKTFFKDLKFAISNWDRFDKEAIVTEKKWLQKLTDLGSKMFSDIEVKAFSFREKEQAQKWIQE